MRTLRQNMTGPDVAAWKRFLNEQGYDVGKLDSRFDDRTTAATIVYQRSEALKPDGIAGPITLGRAGLAGMETLRRITEAESSPAIRSEASRIIKAHVRSPFGTEVPFDADGREYVARIEEHFHPHGGKAKPWGYHHGVSVFVRVGVATQEVDEDDEDEADTMPPPPPVPEPAPEQKFRLGATSLKRLKGVHPDLVRVVERAIQITPIDFMVVDGLRTVEQQRKNVANGASKTMNSRHLTGHAVDLAPFVDGLPSWHWPHYRILRGAMVQASAELGIPLRAGANWDGDEHWEEKGEGDGPHWELPRSVYP